MNQRLLFVVVALLVLGGFALLGIKTYTTTRNNFSELPKVSNITEPAAIAIPIPVAPAPPASPITVIYPNGGEVLNRGAITKIRWRYTGPIVPDTFAMTLVRADRVEAVQHVMFCYDDLQTPEPDGTFSFDWSTGYGNNEKPSDAPDPHVPDGEYRIVVYNCGNVSDTSDAPFRITTTN